MFHTVQGKIFDVLVCGGKKRVMGWGGSSADVPGEKQDPAVKEE